MNEFHSKAIVESLRRQYPAGAKVRLVSMDDPYAPPVGTMEKFWELTTLEASWLNGATTLN